MCMSVVRTGVWVCTNHEGVTEPIMQIVSSGVVQAVGWVQPQTSLYESGSIFDLLRIQIATTIFEALLDRLARVGVCSGLDKVSCGRTIHR